MAIDYTTVGLLASIRRRASIPSTATTGSSDADLLAYVNEELQLHMTAQLMQVREEYYLRHYDVALGSTTYQVPVRAIAGSLRNVQLIDADGRPVVQLTRLAQERLPEYMNMSQTAGYLMEGNTVRLFPVGTWGGASKLRLSYFERPSEVVALGSTAKVITNINPGTGGITFASPNGITTNSKVDFIRGGASFETLGIDITPLTAASTSITVPLASLPPSLQVGDYVSLAQTSPVPQLPSEFHPILAQRVAVRFLAAVNNVEQLQVAQRELVRMEEALGILTAPRVEGGPRKIFQANGTLAGNRWRVRNGVGVL